jgi:hypothetical protein
MKEKVGVTEIIIPLLQSVNYVSLVKTMAGEKKTTK